MPDWVEIAIRTLFAVVILFIITKILGKRQVSQLSLFEYITGITIGNLAAAISLEIDSPWYLGVTSLTVWVLISLGIMFIQIKSKTLRNLIDGKVTALIKDGEIVEENLRKEKLALDELLGQLRKKNVFRIEEVEYACIEPNGALSVLLKKEHLPLTASTIGLTVRPESEPQNIIMDGIILDKPLKDSGLTKDKLYQELEKRNVKLDEVFFAQVDASKKLHLDLHDNKKKASFSSCKPENKLAFRLSQCEKELEKKMKDVTDSESLEKYEQLLLGIRKLIREEQ